MRVECFLPFLRRGRVSQPQIEHWSFLLVPCPFPAGGGELRLPYEVPVGGARGGRPAGWPGPHRPSRPHTPNMGDPHHPTFGHLVRRGLIRGQPSSSYTTRSRDLGY